MGEVQGQQRAGTRHRWISPRNGLLWIAAGRLLRRLGLDFHCKNQERLHSKDEAGLVPLVSGLRDGSLSFCKPARAEERTSRRGSNGSGNETLYLASSRVGGADRVYRLDGRKPSTPFTVCGVA